MLISTGIIFYPSSQQTLKSLDQSRLSCVYAHGGPLMRTISRRTLCSEVAFWAFSCHWSWIIESELTCNVETKTFKLSSREAHRVSQRTFSFDCLPISSLTAALFMSCSSKASTLLAENLKANATSWTVSMMFLISMIFLVTYPFHITPW